MSSQGEGLGNSLPQELAQAMGMDFLKTELESIEAKIKARREHLAIYYPEGKELPEGEESILQVYQQEKALIEELMQESRDRPIGEVFRQHLKTAQRRLLEQSGEKLDSDGARSKYWQAETELEILNESIRQWLDLLDGRAP